MGGKGENSLQKGENSLQKRGKFPTKGENSLHKKGTIPYTKKRKFPTKGRLARLRCNVGRFCCRGYGKDEKWGRG